MGEIKSTKGAKGAKFVQDVQRDKLCREFAVMMQAVIDGEATDEETVALYSHMEHCKRCAGLYDNIGSIKKASYSLIAEPPSGLKDRIIKANADRIISEAEKEKKLRKKRLVMSFGGLSAAAVLCVAAWFGADMILKNPNKGEAMNDSFIAEGSFFEDTRSVGEVEESFIVESEAMSEGSVSVDSENIFGIERFPEAENGEEEWSIDGSEALTTETESGKEGKAYAERIALYVAALKLAGNDYGEVIYLETDSFPSADCIKCEEYPNVRAYVVNDYSAFVAKHEMTISLSSELSYDEFASCGIGQSGDAILLLVSAS